jgi:hypothetical protein
MKVLGLDFTSAPSKRKPITCVESSLKGCTLVAERLRTLNSLEEFETFLQHDGPWIAGIDLPFGQPRRLIDNIGWPANSWEEYVGFLSQRSAEEFDQILKGYKKDRPKGDKQHLRRTDELAGSKSPMMMYGVPVGKMFFRGAPLLAKSLACIIPCRPTDSDRLVVEAYPGIVARKWSDGSYKGESPSKDTTARKMQREGILSKILSSSLTELYGLELHMEGISAETLISDPKGDRLDSLLCTIQAAWAYSAKQDGFGIPADADPLEGWIVDPSTQGA